MDIYDKKNYEPGSLNAVRLEERIRRAGAWPKDPLMAQKMLRRQLEILRKGDMAEDKAITLFINRKDDETVRLCYWRNRAPKLCQDLGLFDWPTRELTIEEIQKRLISAGIGYWSLDEDFETVRENARKKIQQLKARYERREKEYNKRKKLETLLELKYRAMLKKVEQTHDIELKSYIECLNPAIIHISWSASSSSAFSSHDLHFSISGEFREEDVSKTFESVIGDILQVVPLGRSLQQSLEKTGNHVLMNDNGIQVKSGPLPHYTPFFLSIDDDEDQEEPVLEGEDVELAEKLYDRVKELGLRIFTPRFFR